MCKIINFCWHSCFNPSFTIFDFVTLKIRFSAGFLVRLNICLPDLARLTNLLLHTVRSKYISGVINEKLERLL